MLYLFFILAAVFILVPLTLEWSTKGWHGTVVAKAWAEISPSPETLAIMRDPIGHLAREISREFGAVKEALAGFFSELEEVAFRIRKVAKAIAKVVQTVVHMMMGSRDR
jgi:hypothetical protein